MRSYATCPKCWRKSAWPFRLIPPKVGEFCKNCNRKS